MFHFGSSCLEFISAHPNGNKLCSLMGIIAKISCKNYTNNNLLFTSIITYLSQSITESANIHALFYT